MTSSIRTGLLTTAAGGEVVLRRVLVRVVSGTSAGAFGWLDRGTLVIGSHEDADLTVQETTVSRFHAELGLLTNGVRLRDLGSTNGTFVGDSRVEAIVIQPNAEFRVGRATIALTIEDEKVELPPQVSRLGRLCGQTERMVEAIAVLTTAAASDAPVLIEGESGTGKSEAARAVHQASPRARGPLISVDPRATEQVLVSAEAARGGTLVIDAVDEVTAQQASALVAVLDRREQGELDFRVIATSRSDLRGRVERGASRRDLYFHVAAIRTVMPPLRERQGDVPLLVHELLTDLGAASHRLAREELRALTVHPFPGNVRELKRWLEHAIAQQAPSAAAAPSRPSDPDLASLPYKQAKEKLLDSFESEYIAELLARHEGNVSRAAQEAGLDRNYLARLAKKHGLR